MSIVSSFDFREGSRSLFSLSFLWGRLRLGNRQIHPDPTTDLDEIGKRFGDNGGKGLGVFSVLWWGCGLLGTLLLFVGCGPDPSDSTQGAGKGERVVVLVPVAPVGGLVERIGGDQVLVKTLVPAGKEPETFSPTPADLLPISDARFFFRVGLPPEEVLVGRLKTISPTMEVVDLREGLPIVSESGEGSHHHHDHGEDHHDDEGIDPHLWMSPANLIRMGRIVTDQLVSLFPEQKEVFETNFEDFRREAEALQKEVSESLSTLTNRTIYVFHPAYGYYCQEFHLRQFAIEAGGKSPKTKDLVELIRRIREEKAPVIFVQPEFSRTAVDKISETTGARILTHSPLSSDPLQSIRELTEGIRSSDQEGDQTSESERKEENEPAFQSQ